jgi:hypothetical protein
MNITQTNPHLLSGHPQRLVQAVLILRLPDALFADDTRREVQK